MLRGAAVQVRGVPIDGGALRRDLLAVDEYVDDDGVDDGLAVVAVVEVAEAPAQADEVVEAVAIEAVAGRAESMVPQAASRHHFVNGELGFGFREGCQGCFLVSGAGLCGQQP